MERKGTNDWLSIIKSQTDVVSIISKFITLKKKGKTWWACCPFHYEKTPSFAVNEAEQYFHCFGCGASGDGITFVSKYENVDFKEACQIIAKNEGITLPEIVYDENVANKKKKVDRILKLLKDTARYYYENLKTPQAKPALDYLKMRNIDTATAVAFGLGYSLGWREVVTYLLSKGYTANEILEAGVCEKQDKGGYLDCYARRLIFPIINSYGDVVGFSARLLEKRDTLPKYKNTTQTIVFDKSKCVYGINLVKKHKQKEGLNEVIIVEGQIDVISLYKNGIHNAVACLGTALTNSHAKELKRLTDKIVVCFDGDGAGIKATLRSIEILVSNGFSVYIATIPNNADPDEYINQYGKDSFDKIIADAKYWVEFLITKYANDYDLQKLEEKNKFIIEALNIIRRLETEAEKDIYLKLVNNLTGISVSTLREDMNKNKELENTRTTELKETNTGISKENAYVKAVRFVLNALLTKKEYAYLSDDIKENLLNGDHIKIYEYVAGCAQTGEKVTIGTLFSMFDMENTPDVAGIINYEIMGENDNEQYYADCVKTLQKSGLEMRQQDLLNKIKQTNNKEEKQALMMQLNKVMTNLKKLQQK